MKMIRFFDYLYYALLPYFRFRYMPFIWLVLLVLIVLEPMGEGWKIALVFLLAFVVVRIDNIFEKRQATVREYFSKTKYSKPGWKFLTNAAWIVLWAVVPAIVFFVTRK